MNEKGKVFCKKITASTQTFPVLLFATNTIHVRPTNKISDKRIKTSQSFYFFLTLLPRLLWLCVSVCISLTGMSRKKESDWIFDMNSSWWQFSGFFFHVWRMTVSVISYETFHFFFFLTRNCLCILYRDLR